VAVVTVLAATAWKTNAEMILACVALGYLRSEWVTLDPTWGRGGWWKLWEPDQLVKRDRSTVEGDEEWDFRSMTYADATFDAVAFDPPYVCVGGRKTTGLADMHDAYGMTAAASTPPGVQDDINAGLSECYRVVKSGGIVLVKCQDYVTSGKLWLGTHRTLVHALALGFLVQDRLEHIAGVRPQPAGRRQCHARRNLSTLFVLRKGS
jgi:hypothetical protein